MGQFSNRLTDPLQGACITKKFVLFQSGTEITNWDKS